MFRTYTGEVPADARRISIDVWFDEDGQLTFSLEMPAYEGQSAEDSREILSAILTLILGEIDPGVLAPQFQPEVH